MSKWELQNINKIDEKDLYDGKLINILLKNRGIKTQKEIDDFLNPILDIVTPKNLDISINELSKAKKRLSKAKKNNEQIIVYGDYDVDGITGTAILWEVLNKNKFNVMPYIPERVDEGYGLSEKGIDNLLKLYPETKLIITVDNGIVANEAVDYAYVKGIDVIITDHHTPPDSLPKSIALIHSVKVCGAAVAYIFANELFDISKSYLELVALATVTDVMTLTDYNRILLIFGLKELRKTQRIGLSKLIDSTKIEKEQIGVYEIGNIIGPRINAMGRIGSGMDSLRLICTTSDRRAEDLAGLLNRTNAQRQQMTFDSVDHARENSSSKKKIIILADESYNQGIVGLISGRITEEFYRPSVVIAKEKEISKGSARSIKGVNIVEILRETKDLLINVGGHPGAAGFSIETKKIPKFKKRLEDIAEKKIKDDLLIKKIKVDAEIPIKYLNIKLINEIQTLAPFGFGNPSPIFMTKKVLVKSLRSVGKKGNHLKLKFESEGNVIDGINFGYNKKIKIRPSDTVDVVYSLSINKWNGESKLDLKVKDIRRN